MRKTRETAPLASLREPPMSSGDLGDGCYQRTMVSSVNLARLTQVLRAGKAFSDPIVVDERSTILDGVHRYRAYRREHARTGQHATVPVERRTYDSARERHEDYLALNDQSRLPLTPFERARLILWARTRRVALERIAAAMSLSEAAVETILRTRVAQDVRGDLHAIKQKLRAVVQARGHVTDAELTLQPRLSGSSYLRDATELTAALAAGIVPRTAAMHEALGLLLAQIDLAFRSWPEEARACLTA